MQRLSLLSATLLLACGQTTPLENGGTGDDGTGTAADGATGDGGGAGPADDGGDDGGDGGGQPPGDDGGDTGTGDPGGGSDGTGDGSTDTGGTDTGDDSNPEPGAPVRFIVMGDAGEGNDAQFEVAATIEQVCADRGCDFVLYLGDNFYDDGVNSVDDQQFIDKFEMPYMDLDLTFYVVLGNHDYGLLASAWEKAQYEIDYGKQNDKWYLPDVWYTFQAGDVQFYGIDTTMLMSDRETAQQQQWLETELENSDAKWQIVYGHHPYISNGSHGNAGNYEGSVLPIDSINGRVVKEFMDESVCGKATIYFSGHDHTRQWLEPSCGTEFIVSGAGAKTTGFAHRDDNPVLYEDDQEEGFMWVEIEGDTMTGVFYDGEGNVDFEQSISL